MEAGAAARSGMEGDILAKGPGEEGVTEEDMVAAAVVVVDSVGIMVVVEDTEEDMGVGESIGGGKLGDVELGEVMISQ